jgi:hypothetical protein
MVKLKTVVSLKSRALCRAHDGSWPDDRNAQATKRTSFAEQHQGFPHSVRRLPLASIYL